MIKKKNKAIFFDRDGILIEAPIIDNKPKSIKTKKEIRFCKHIKSVCKKYSKDFVLIMVTNQPEYKRGANTKKNINDINKHIKKMLNLDFVYVNFSDNDKNNDRKPNPGMLLKAKKKFNLNLNKSFMLGDRWRDVGAGNKAKCKTIFLDRKYDEKIKYKPKYKIKSLKEIFSIIK
tara:strand:+ start:29296 stop:29820 length:525 start_codon:yes stop_codon:yes gene_type:complete